MQIPDDVFEPLTESVDRALHTPFGSPGRFRSFGNQPVDPQEHPVDPCRISVAELVGFFVRRPRCQKSPHPWIHAANPRSPALVIGGASYGYFGGDVEDPSSETVGRQSTIARRHRRHLEKSIGRQHLRIKRCCSVVENFEIRFWNDDRLRILLFTEPDEKRMLRVLLSDFEIHGKRLRKVFDCPFADVFGGLQQKSVLPGDVAFVDKPVAQPVKVFLVVVDVSNVRQGIVIRLPATSHPSHEFPFDVFWRIQDDLPDPLDGLWIFWRCWFRSVFVRGCGR